MQYKIDEYKAILKERLYEKRYHHSLCVADEAKRLAEIYGADAEKAYLAGLLHDITKNSSSEEHLKIFSDFGIILSSIEQNAEKLWHAMSGAAYVKEILKINDSEIIDAIRYHTTAKKDMSLFTKILYIADFTSVDRDYSDVDVLRKVLNENSLEEAIIYALKYSINELMEDEKAIHPDTLEAYNQLVMKGR